MPESIRVVFFAGARDRAGVAAATIDPQEVTTVQELRHHLAMRFDNLAAWLPKVAIAVNEEYGNDATILRPGDTVAVIPPVSGG